MAGYTNRETPPSSTPHSSPVQATQARLLESIGEQQQYQEAWQNSTPLTHGEDLRLEEDESTSPQDHANLPLRPRAPANRQKQEARQYELDTANNLRPISQANRKPAPWIERVWLWELSACIMGIACLVAIVGALIYEDGRRLDQWRLFIAPNALVSFLGTLSKSCLLLAVSEVISQYKWLHFARTSHKLVDLQLFDAASRGPLGSAEFLFRKHRHVVVASVAAGVVLLSLLVDPFIQLVFSFPSRAVSLDVTSASILTTTAWDSGTPTSSPNYLEREGTIAAQLQAAILQGLYSEHLNKQVHCPTGNCAWAAVNTLGICASCNNVTAHVMAKPLLEAKQSFGRNSSSVGSNYTLPSVTANVMSNSLIRARHTFGYNSSSVGVNYTFPSGTQLVAWTDTKVHANASARKTFTVWNSTQSVSFPNDVAQIVAIDAVQRIPIQNEENSNAASAPVTCWHCIFEFCSKTYENFTVTNGTISMPAPREEPLYLYSGFDRPPPLRATTNTSGHFSYKVNYTMNSGDFHTFGSYLIDLFSTGYYQNGWFYRPLGQPQYISPNIAGSLAKSTNIDRTVRSMAESLTERIRTGQNSSAVSGEAFATVTFIKVRWAWLVLPMALVAVSCAVLVIAIVQTQSTGMVPWKSSGLALLFYQLEPWDVPNEAFSSRQRLERFGKRIKSVLIENDEHHAFISENAQT